MFKRFFTTTAGVVTLATLAASAVAQSINYGELEQMFGEPVTTSATGKPQRASEVPMAMTIITAEQIHHSAAVDLPGVLREYTDLDVIQWSRGSSDVAVRGYNGALTPRLLVLVNGRQVYVDYFGFTNWDAIPIQLGEIHQIEVVKGPNTALFGFNAAAGVVNIITANPLYDQVNQASVRVGTQNYRELSAVASGRVNDRLGVRLSAGGYNAHDILSGAPDLQTVPLSRQPFRRAANLDLLAQVTDWLQVGFEASHSLVSQNQAMIHASARPNRMVSESLKGSFSATTDIGLIDAQVYRNVVRTNYDLMASDQVTADGSSLSDIANTSNLATHESITSAKLQDLFKLGTDHTFRLAGEYRYNTMNSVPIPSARAGYTVYSGSAMWDWAISPQLDWTSAVRFDRLELERSGEETTSTPVTVTIGGVQIPLGTNTWPYTNDSFNHRSANKISANSGLVYKASDTDTLRASYARGIQVPSLVSYAWYSPITRSVPVSNLSLLNPALPASAGSLQLPALLSGNPTLEPTVVTNYELGYTRDLPALDSKASLALFYQTNHNLLTNDPYSFWYSPEAQTLVSTNYGGAKTLLQASNIGNSSARGLELGLDGHNERWRWGASYRLEFIHDQLNFTQYNSDGTLNAALFFEGATPHHQFNLRGGVTWGSWELDLFGRYSSSYQLANPVLQGGLGLFGGSFTKFTVPDQVLLDGRLAYNLTDSAWIALNAINFQSGTSQLTNLPAVERQVFLNLGIRF